jgi:hypothetical protein
LTHSGIAACIAASEKIAEWRRWPVTILRPDVLQEVERFIRINQPPAALSAHLGLIAKNERLCKPQTACLTATAGRLYVACLLLTRGCGGGE